MQKVILLCLALTECSDSSNGISIIISVYVFFSLTFFVVDGMLMLMRMHLIRFGFVFSQLNNGSLYWKKINKYRILNSLSLSLCRPAIVSHLLSSPVFSYLLFVMKCQRTFSCHVYPHTQRISRCKLTMVQLFHIYANVIECVCAREPV